MPFAAYLVALCVVVLARVSELFRVIRLRLACAQGIGDGQHRAVGLLEKMSLSRPGSIQPMLPALVYFVWCKFLFRRPTSTGYRRRSHWRFFRSNVLWSLDIPRVLTRQIDDRKTHPRDKISAF